MVVQIGKRQGMTSVVYISKIIGTLTLWNELLNDCCLGYVMLYVKVLFVYGLRMLYILSI